MKDLVICGAGGLGREVAVLVEQINKHSPQWKMLGFFDDNVPAGKSLDGHRVLGSIAHINAHKSDVSVIVAIASSSARESIVSKIVNSSVDYPSIIHPNANTGNNSNKFGRGCIITAGCIFTTGVELSEFVIVNLASTIGHDVRIGAYSSVMPGCNISGNVSIGSRCLIGTGAQILQNKTIGEGSVVGAGAVVTRNLPIGSKVVGVPARPMYKTK